MAHEIETFSDGSGSFVSYRQDAWHALGTVVNDALTATGALTGARLDGWNVRKLELQAVELNETGVEILPVPDNYAVARTHPETGRTDILGVAGKDYTPIQNEILTDVLQTIADDAGATFETAGSLNEGRRVFVSMRMPGDLLIAGQDALDMYLIALSSHDTSQALTLMCSPVRPVCSNTIRMALGAAKSTYVIRHTKSAKDRIAEARNGLGITVNYSGAIVAEAERLLSIPCTAAQFDKVVKIVFPPTTADSAARARGIEARRNELLYPLWTADTQANIAGTAWAAVQAIGEYEDHFAQAPSAAVRAARTLSAGVANRKQAAYEAVLTVTDHPRVLVSAGK